MSATVPSTDPPIKIILDQASGPFKPFYSPQDILLLGAFGGNFFGNTNSSALIASLPSALFDGVPTQKYLLTTYNAEQNYFGVTSQVDNRSFGVTTKLKQLHPLGWYQWYCQFYYGARSKADMYRVTQWQRAINVQLWYIANSTYSGSGNRWTDTSFLPARRQKLIELAWDPTQNPANFGVSVTF